MPEQSMKAFFTYLKHIKAFFVLEKNKNLKFKMGVGVAIKSKETSSKLAI